MAIYNVHGGHSLICRGASSILDEVNEDRVVKNRVIELLRMAGHTVYDCTDDVGKTQNENLKNIVTKCNSHNVDLDISIHLNSGKNDLVGNGSTGGVEVYGYDSNTKTVGAKICSEIASTLGYTNRGFKTTQNLYVLRNTHSPAILIECAFVDDKDDADRWNANRCADAIVKGIIGAVPTSSTSASTSTSNKYAVGQTISYGTSYKNPTDPCGYEAAVGGSGHGTITAIVSGQAKYQLDSGVFCNDGDIIGLYVAPTVPTPSQSDNNTSTLSVNATYMVYAGGKWYSAVRNLEDYAGDGKNAIRGVAIKVDKGSVKYRVHIRGGNWYSYVSGFNTSDGNNGYAGDKRNDIDAIEVYYTTPTGYQYKKAKYRLAPIGRDYYSWQTDNDKGNGMDGYAGNFGTSFGKFQLYIE